MADSRQTAPPRPPRMECSSTVTMAPRSAALRTASSSSGAIETIFTTRALMPACAKHSAASKARATMTPQAIIATRADVRTVRVLWGENRALIYASPGDIRLALDATIRFAYRAARGAGAGSDDEVGLGVDRGRFRL